ncbi:hypothetical protein JCM1840_001125 [Sporobolomyces johnsonii]
MSSPHLIKRVAIAGVGNVGEFMLEELLKAGLSVTVLTRAGTFRPFNTPAKVTPVDYTSSSSLEEALKGIDAVVSCLNNWDAQTQLIHAAKKADVKLFVPSEYGIPSDWFTKDDHPLLYCKKVAQETLKSVKMPAVFVWGGLFTDMTFMIPFLGFDLKNKQVTLVGKGDTPISFTTRRDVARFLAHHLATLGALPAPSSPTLLRIEGDRQSLNSCVTLYESLHPGVKLEVRHVSLAETDQAAHDIEGAGVVPSFLKALLASWERGGGLVDQGQGTGALSNEEWPDWNPTKVKDTLGQV